MRRTALCLLLCLLHGTPGLPAAEADRLPPWVVPVLRLVSATHVEPTTGIVLSADGLVLVPADFASPGDEIVVLDGGTDIIRNGRPARLQRGYPELGLEILRAEGLRRSGAPLAPAAPAAGSAIHLRAFPPAEQIAEGAAPVHVTARVAAVGERGQWSFEDDDGLPNVTGPLLDDCGNLVGYSVAAGIQSLSSVEATDYRWLADLGQLVAELQLPVTGSVCPPASGEDPPTPVPEAAAEAEPVADTSSGSGDDKSDSAGHLTPELAAGEAEMPIDRLPPFEEDTVATPAGEAARDPQRRPGWLWLVSALVLFGAGLLLHRLRGRRTPSPPAAADQLAAASPAGASSAAPDAARSGDRAADSLLVLRGERVGGQLFETSAPVGVADVHLEIGRGDTDLVLDSPSVSRRHARLGGSIGALTLTDLGSSNGTSINGVPCLEGEVMYVEPGDFMTLGDVRCTLTIETLAATDRTS